MSRKPIRFVVRQVASGCPVYLTGEGYEGVTTLLERGGYEPGDVVELRPVDPLASDELDREEHGGAR